VNHGLGLLRVHPGSIAAVLDEIRAHETIEKISTIQESKAIEAIEHTAAGNHVNLVTHGEHGHPATSLHAKLDERFGDAITYEYVQQCSCGGHVTKVRVEDGVSQ
jgi:putative CGCGG family rSAM target protein